MSRRAGLVAALGLVGVVGIAWWLGRHGEDPPEPSPSQSVDSERTGPEVAVPTPVAIPTSRFDGSKDQPAERRTPETDPAGSGAKEGPSSVSIEVHIPPGVDLAAIRFDLRANGDAVVRDGGTVESNAWASLGRFDVAGEAALVLDLRTPLGPRRFFSKARRAGDHTIWRAIVNPGVVRGRLVTATGAPIGAVEAKASCQYTEPKTGRTHKYGLGEFETLGDGSFLVDAPRHHDRLLVAGYRMTHLRISFAQNGPYEWTRIEVASGDAIIIDVGDIVVTARPLLASGTVVDEGGTPVAEAYVRALGFGPNADLASSPTDDHGRFVLYLHGFRSLGPFRLIASGEECRTDPEDRTRYPPGAKDVRVVVLRTARVVGKILWTGDGRPPDLDIQLLDLAGAQRASAWVRWPTESQGEIPFVIRHIQAGRYRIHVENSGTPNLPLGRHEGPIVVASGATVDVGAISITPGVERQTLDVRMADGSRPPLFELWRDSGRLLLRGGDRAGWHRGQAPKPPVAFSSLEGAAGLTPTRAFDDWPAHIMVSDSMPGTTVWAPGCLPAPTNLQRGKPPRVTLQEGPPVSVRIPRLSLPPDVRVRIVPRIVNPTGPKYGALRHLTGPPLVDATDGGTFTVRTYGPATVHFVVGLLDVRFDRRRHYNTRLTPLAAILEVKGNDRVKSHETAVLSVGQEAIAAALAKIGR